MTNLKEILQKINPGQGTVGKLVNDQEFYKNAKLSLAEAGQGHRRPGRHRAAERARDRSFAVTLRQSHD